MRHRFRLLSAVGLVGAALLATPAHAQPVELPTEPSACSIDAWVSFAFDPAVAVYDAPSETAVVLGYLSNDSNNPDDDRYSIEFHVTEARPGWLRIRDAQDRGGSDVHGRALPPRDVYQGEGWIRSHMAQIGVQSSLGYLRPDAQSPRVLDLQGRWLTEAGWVNGIRACSGEWLLLDFVIENRGRSGGAAAGARSAPVSTGTAWFRGICSVQETTCDMRSVDNPP